MCPVRTFHFWWATRTLTWDQKIMSADIQRNPLGFHEGAFPIYRCVSICVTNLTKSQETSAHSLVLKPQEFWSNHLTLRYSKTLSGKLIGFCRINFMKPTIKIDYISDVACPWCAVGLGNLNKAIAQLSDRANFEIHFHPFELNPNMPLCRRSHYL
jgi:hypothetical protein